MVGRASPNRCGKGSAGGRPVCSHQSPLQRSDHLERDFNQPEQWRGRVSRAEKQDLPRRVRAEFFGIRREEPDGTAVREAPAAGTPVIAMARGCLPSLVEDGVTDFLPEDEAGCTRALPQLDELDPAACAAAARRWFAPAVMAQGCERNRNQVVSRSAEVAKAARHDGQAVKRLVR
jgi:glycosyltransferase involved in cell wall biosynthesis